MSSAPRPRYLQECSGIGIAAYFGLEDALKLLLLQNVTGIDEKTCSYFPALHLAAMQGNFGSIEILLEYGANIESRATHFGLTPLNLAITNRHEETARMLVEKGASVLATSDVPFHKTEKVRPFAFVDWDSPIPFLQFLLDHGADLDSRNERGSTQLSTNTRRGGKEAVRWLLEQGARIDSKDAGGRTALHYAVKENFPEIVELLLRGGADPTIIDKDNNTILQYACKRGSIDLVKRFLDFDIDIDIGNYWGETALYLAAANGQHQILDLLLANDADVDEPDRTRRTPLLAALRRRSLLNAGSAPDSQDDYGFNALHYAAAAGAMTADDIAAMRELLKADTLASERSWPVFTIKAPRDADIPGELVIQNDRYTILFYGPQAFADSNTRSDHLDSILVDMVFGRWECRSWEDGLTALDIALLFEHEEYVRILEPLTDARTESPALSEVDFLCNLYGVFPIKRLEEELKRQEIKNGDGWRPNRRSKIRVTRLVFGEGGVIDDQVLGEENSSFL
ncbi:MAG: hypothetical protein Q9184_005339 [Pyrenodesmia sp. 2 TL-2023]